ncbi:type VI secretion system baseplate subunit TssE, partial [Serratia marcescens]|uniref:type VI secretion system baseplate subunit TssE n=1 Tax=Serratia marcescens TaxID=615 RepID=UPI0011E6E145
NTRSGSCYGSPELGVSDFNDDPSDFINLQEWMVRAIRECILRYEPRISEVKVLAAEVDNYSPLELRLHIVAYINFSDVQDVLEFDILLDNHQHWCVE